MDSIELVVNGLFEDPMFVFIQPDEVRRRRLLDWYVPGLLRLLEAKGRVDVVDGRAAALWIPPESKLRPPLVPRIQLVSAPFRVGISPLQRAMEFAAAVDDVSRERKRDAWQLIHVAVDPTRRTRGHATEVLARTLGEADQSRRRSFVAATSGPAVEFLATQGFEVDRHLRVEGLPQFWTLVREPR